MHAVSGEMIPFHRYKFHMVWCIYGGFDIRLITHFRDIHCIEQPPYSTRSGGVLSLFISRFGLRCGALPAPHARYYEASSAILTIGRSLWAERSPSILASVLFASCLLAYCSSSIYAFVQLINFRVDAISPLAKTAILAFRHSFHYPPPTSRYGQVTAWCQYLFVILCKASPSTSIRHFSVIVTASCYRSLRSPLLFTARCRHDYSHDSSLP